MAAEGGDPLMDAFFQVDHKAFSDDVYNACDEVAMDGMDAVERFIVQHLQHGSFAGIGGRHKQNPVPPEALAEVQAGCDFILGQLLDDHERFHEAFTSYVRHNLLGLHRSLGTGAREAVERHVARRSELGLASAAAGTAPAALPSARRFYSPAEEALLDASIADAEAQLAAARRKVRALARVDALFSKRLPEAEEADAALTALLEQFQAGAAAERQAVASGARTGAQSAAAFTHAISSFMASASRFKGMVDRLEGAAPGLGPAVPGMLAAALAPPHAAGQQEQGGGGAGSSATDEALAGGALSGPDILARFQADRNEASASQL